MLSFVLFDLARLLQPIVLLDGSVWSLGRVPGPLVLLTASCSFPLRRLGSLEEVQAHHIRLHSSEVATALQDAIRRERGLQRDMDALMTFVAWFAPSLDQRDYFEHSQGTGVDSRATVPLVTQTPPLPELPGTALLMLGRCWRLEPGIIAAAPAREAWRVCDGSRDYWVRDCISLQPIEAAWKAILRLWMDQLAVNLATQAATSDAGLLAEAREAVRRQGFWLNGDAVFIDCKPAPRAGYLLPMHYNRTLGRDSQNLALTVPLTQPVHLSGLSIMELTAGQWVPVHAPNGICLGALPVFGQNPASLASILRLGATRLASNGIFHSSDPQ